LVASGNLKHTSNKLGLFSIILMTSSNLMVSIPQNDFDVTNEPNLINYKLEVSSIGYTKAYPAYSLVVLGYG
jgi:hypothetical protein